jgi:hypothetical protein
MKILREFLYLYFYCWNSEIFKLGFWDPISIFPSNGVQNKYRVQLIHYENKISSFP